MPIATSVRKHLLHSVGEGARRADEGGPQSAPRPQRPTPHPMRYIGPPTARRLRHRIIRFFSTGFRPIGPYDIVPPNLLAAANHLIVRGARLLAHAHVYERAKPFPPGDHLGRTVAIALLKLAYRIDPDAP